MSKKELIEAYRQLSFTGLDYNLKFLPEDIKQFPKDKLLKHALTVAIKEKLKRI